MLDWIISLSIAAVFAGLAIVANSKIGTVREKDQRPHLLPWGLIMVGSVFVIFLVLVHLLNVAGVETGPEHSLLGRF